MDLARHVAGVGALADPTRRALYEYVASRSEAVGREEAARALGIRRHTANFHLDKLVEVGLLSTEYRRLTSRTGPGAGRPSKLYRRAEREWAVSLPERHYDLIGRILADGIERVRRAETPLQEAIDTAATEAGRKAVAGADPGDPAALANVLAAHGYEPRLGDEVVVLANCPFHLLAQSHPELTCGINQRFVQGMADGLGSTGTTALLDPEPGLCCVKISGPSTSATPSTRGG